MFKKTLIAIGVIIAVFLVVVATRPSEYHIERSVTVSAPASVIFANVNESRKWEAWSPWPEVDPMMKMTYGGPEAGVGSYSAWVGKKMGEGRATIIESRPSELIRYKLENYKPMAHVSS